MSSHTLFFTIPGMPMGKARPRFRRNGMAYTPKETKQYEQKIKDIALHQANICQYIKPSEDTPMRMHITAWYPIPASYSNKKRQQIQDGTLQPNKKPDLDNIMKIIADALNHIAYHDDKQIVECVLRKQYVTENNDPNVAVFVEAMYE